MYKTEGYFWDFCNVVITCHACILYSQYDVSALSAFPLKFPRRNFDHRMPHPKFCPVRHRCYCTRLSVNTYRRTAFSRSSAETTKYISGNSTQSNKKQNIDILPSTRFVYKYKIKLVLHCVSDLTWRVENTFRSFH